MAEPDALQDQSYVAPTRPLQTGGPSSPNVSILNHHDKEHRHPQFFTWDDTVTWIKRQLGGDVFRLEGLHGPSAVEDCIYDALMLYGNRVPRLWYEMVPAGTAIYKPKAAAVLGVVRMDFIYPIQSAGGYAAEYNWISNLTGVPGIIPSAGPGLLMPAGDLMRFIMARKTFQRVASIMPQYMWDASAQLLHIYNFSSNYYSFALMTLSKTFAEVNPNHKQWLRQHALFRAKLLLAENRAKLDGTIQAPGGGTINVNSDKLQSNAREDYEKSLEALNAFQTRIPPIWGD